MPKAIPNPRSLQELLEFFQIRVIRNLERFPQVGRNPSGYATLGQDEKGIYIALTTGQDPYHKVCVGSVFHELVHALAGPSSLQDEFEMLPLEYALSYHLTVDQMKIWRREFATYGFDWTSSLRQNTEITNNDAVFNSEEWVAARVLAHEQKLVTKKGRPNWNHLRKWSALWASHKPA